MDLRNKQLHVIGYVTSIEATLKRADSLIRLAEENPNDANTLAACAAIVLAVALEQGIQTLFSDSAETFSMEDAVDVSETKAMPFVKTRNQLWYKVQSLPRIISDDRFDLDEQHPISRMLKELIDTRNALAHVKEHAIHLVTPNDGVRIEEDQVIVKFSAPLTVWQTITLDKVQKFREAVLTYNREILFPDDGNIVVGNIVYER